MAAVGGGAVVLPGPGRRPRGRPDDRAPFAVGTLLAVGCQATQVLRQAKSRNVHGIPNGASGSALRRAGHQGLRTLHLLWTRCKARAAPRRSCKSLKNQPQGYGKSLTSITIPWKDPQSCSNPGGPAGFWADGRIYPLMGGSYAPTPDSGSSSGGPGWPLRNTGAHVGNRPLDGIPWVQGQPHRLRDCRDEHVAPAQPSANR